MISNSEFLILPAIKIGTTYIKSVFYVDICGNPIDLTGYTAKMQFRNTLQSDVALIDLSTDNNTIVISGAAGQITFTISSVITSMLTPWVNLDYDLFIYSPTAVVTPVIGGRIPIVGSAIQ